MYLDQVLQEVRALRGRVIARHHGYEQLIVLRVLNEVISILWLARYDEFVKTDERMRSILKGEDNEQPSAG